MLRRAAIGLLPLLLFALACPIEDPIRMRGVVQQMDYEDHDGSLQRGKRIAGAEIELHCRDHQPNTLGKTDEMGRFHHRAAVEIPQHCRLTARHPDYLSRTVSVADICARGTRANCQYIGFTLRLADSGGDS